jgi:hypothetical protein
MTEVEHPGDAGYHGRGVQRRRLGVVGGHRVPVGHDPGGDRSLRTHGDVQQAGLHEFGTAPREHGFAADPVAVLRGLLQDGHRQAGARQPHGQCTSGDAAPDDRDVGRPLVHRQVLASGGTCPGGMFWLSRKTFAGSYLLFTSASLG